MHRDDITTAVWAAIMLTATIALCGLHSWRDVELARATGKAPEESSFKLKVRMGGEGGAP